MDDKPDSGEILLKVLAGTQLLAEEAGANRNDDQADDQPLSVFPQTIGGRNVVVHCSTRDRLMGPCPYLKIIAFDIRRAISRISDATRVMITRASLVGRICRPATEFLTINRICHRAHSRLSCASRAKVPLRSTS